MELHRLRIVNFRLHADTDIHFGPGITAVVGPDGANLRWMDIGEETDIYLPRVDWFPDGESLAVQRQSRNQQTLENVRADITEAREMERRLSFQATHDALTGLVNRREFERRVSTALQEAHVDDTLHGLIFLDLDQFKIVNDTCGRSAGDEMLRQISGVLQNRLRGSDTLARLGGD